MTGEDETFSARANVLQRFSWEPIAGVVFLVVFTLYVVNRASESNVYLYNACLIAALGAIALNVLMGTTGQVSIGSAAFFYLGSFGTAWANRTGLSFPVDIGVSIVVAVAVGALVALTSFRIQGMYLAMATLATHFILYTILQRYQVEAVGETGFQLEPQFTEQGLEGQQRAWAWLLTVVVALTFVAALRLVKSRLGRALRLIRTHETVAASMGVRVGQYKIAVFALSSAVFALAGGLQAYLVGVTSVQGFTLALAISYIAMIVVGGMDSVWGSVMGAFVVTSLPTLVANVLPHLVTSDNLTTLAPQIALAVYGALIIVVITLARGGLAGLGSVAAGLARRLLPPPATSLRRTDALVGEAGSD